MVCTLSARRPCSRWTLGRSGGPLTPQTPGRRDGLGLGLVRQADKGTAEDKRGLCLPSAVRARGERKAKGVREFGGSS